MHNTHFYGSTSFRVKPNINRKSKKEHEQEEKAPIGWWSGLGKGV